MAIHIGSLLCIIIIFVFKNYCDAGLSNVALGKPTYQTSTLGAYVASNAVDGITNGDILAGSCINTEASSAEYWEVDLGDVYMIYYVNLFNRLDCCGERTRNVQVSIGFEQNDYVLSGYLEGLLGSNHTFQMDSPTNGRWVRISRDSVGDELNFCEVEVYAHLLSIINSGLSNVALGKPTYQTSTLEPYVSSKAVDGITNGDMFAGSCMSTEASSAEYWEVDLGDVYMIYHVNLFNRLDCCGERTSNVQVFVGFDQNEYVLSAYLEGLLGSHYTFLMDLYTHGRWVRISRGSAVNNELNFCDVEVYAELLTNVNNGVSNVALGKPTYQTSTHEPYVSSKAVDGITNGDMFAGSCIHTGASLAEYWEVDLGDVYMIYHVNLFNRLDNDRERTRNVQVFVGYDQNDYVLSGYLEGLLGIWYTFQMNLYTYGRWVRISRDSVNSQLQFCEVEVYAEPLANVKNVRFRLLSDRIGVDTLLSTIPNSSAIVCAALCKSLNNCVGFNFDTSTLECTTFGTPTASSEIVPGHLNFYRKG